MALAVTVAVGADAARGEHEAVSGHVNLAAKAASGSLVTLVGQAVKMTSMLAATAILARLLTPAEYGLIAMVMAFIGVAEIFRDFGLSTAALQASKLTQQQHSNLFWANVLVGIALGVTVFLVGPAIAEFYGQPEIADLARLLAIVYVLNGATTQFRTRVNRSLRFVALAAIDVVPYIVGIIAAITLAAAGLGVWALALQQIVTALAGLIGAAASARWRPSLPRRTPMDGLFRFGASLVGAQLISYATRNIDSIGIGRVWGPHSLGLYDRAYQLMVLPLSQINTPMSRVAIPVLSRSRDVRDDYIRYVRKAQLVALYGTSAIYSVAIVLGPELVTLFLGQGWEATGRLLQILAVGGVFRSLVQVAYWIYMSRGLATAQLKYFLVAQPLLALIILAGLWGGPEGVAWAHSLGFICYWVISIWWVGRVAALPVRGLFSDAIRAVGIVAVPATVLGLAVKALISASSIGSWAVPAAVGALVLGYAGAYALHSGVRADVAILLRFARLAVKR